MKARFNNFFEGRLFTFWLEVMNSGLSKLLLLVVSYGFYKPNLTLKSCPFALACFAGMLFMVRLTYTRFKKTHRFQLHF